MSHGAENRNFFTLNQAIETAVTVNLDLKQADEQTNAAAAVVNQRKTAFLPVLGTAYQYRHKDNFSNDPITGTSLSEDEYSFSASITQPIFKGFAILNQYRMAGLDFDAAKFEKERVRQDLVLEVKNAYYTILKNQKLEAVAKEAVNQLAAHLEVAQNFYKVGMIPLNDLLKAKVELANAKQDLIEADYRLLISRSGLNRILRHPINSNINIQDVVHFSALNKDLSFCISIAEDQRIEIKVAELLIKKAGKAVQLAKKDYYPSIDLKAGYYRSGDNWDVNGGLGAADPDRWDITATASWNIWEWGRTRYNIKEQSHYLSSAEFEKEDMIEKIRLEVKSSYLTARESEKNIVTVKEAVVQAKENFRISEERYKEQMATSTDVLDAQTLLSTTMTNYYNALYDFQLSKASLARAMGLNETGDI
ncbi:TolC family protein [Desulfobacterales bacterium HSG16]|nr:TolC family protein [Desulfobacterales bacterium HSG16]